MGTVTEKNIDATPNRPEGQRKIDAQSVLIDLPAYIRQIKAENAWHESDRNGITVYKTGHMRIVLGGLHKNAKLQRHTTEGAMNIQVIEGQLEVSSEGVSATLGNEQMMAIHKGAGYSATAAEETIYLLTMTGTD